MLDNRSLNWLFIDECGKSVPEIPPQPQFFALGAIAISAEDTAQYITTADEIKLQFLNTTQMTFHEPYMRNHDGPYYFGGDSQKQAEFDSAIDELVATTEFSVFGVGIRKTGFSKDFVATGIDPYLPTDAYTVAIEMLLERYVDYLAHHPSNFLGRIIFESQGPKEDAFHQLGYARLLLDGTQWVPDSAFRNWLETGLRFTPKSGSDPMELADMFSRELFEWVRGGCQVQPKRWNLFSKKIYIRGDGMRGKFGIKIFPDSDIHDIIEMHRKGFGISQ